MKIFVIGMPQSGRTTVAKTVSQDSKYNYIDAASWVKSAFREPKPGEHPQQFNDEFHYWYINRLKLNPRMIVDNIYDSMEAYGDQVPDFIIDGVSSPKDFCALFDYNQDFIVFLNRTDGDVECKDYENIGVSVMRDYCFWLSSAGLLPKDRWYEYNFKMAGEESDFVKSLGSKNSVFIVKSINKVISHLKDALQKMEVSPLDPES